MVATILDTYADEREARTISIDLVRPELPAFAAMEPDLGAVFRSGMVTKGPFLQRLEGEIARHLDVRHAIGVSSCTAGLMLTYRALGLSGEVIVPSFTFMATVSALVWAGLRPVFCDVDPDTCLVRVDAIEPLITDATSAIVAVHCFGNPADADALEALARRYGPRLIFDAAHGFGARRGGVPVGSRGDAEVFSLSPTKLLIAGEGGIVATNDDDLAHAVRTGREYGNDGRYDSAFAGFNARMPETSAVMALHSLRLLESAAQRRNAAAALYRERLGKLPGIGFQTVAPGSRSSYKDFSITVDEAQFGASRDELAAALRRAGIDTRTYYDPPVHLQTAYAPLHDGRPLPGTERLAARSLSLPIWSRMDDDTVIRIADAVEDVHRSIAGST